MFRIILQVAFGEGVVREHLGKYIQKGSKVLCTYGGGSIMKNGAKDDVEAVLKEQGCEVRWEGGIPPNPEYERLVEILAVIREFKPDVLVAVGGGSVLDGTKFMALASDLKPEEDAWEVLLVQKRTDLKPLPVCAVMTIPATGSEWNPGMVISRRATKEKLGGMVPGVYPTVSLLDPNYTRTLPVRQLRNGVFDCITHCFDCYLVGEMHPLWDNLIMSVIREMVTIGPEVVKEGSSMELHERLIAGAALALNGMLSLGVGEWGVEVHSIGHMLTVKWGIDHGATLAIVAPHFWENQFESRKEQLAASAAFIFDVREGTVEERARAFIAKMREFIKSIGLPSKVSEWPGVKIEEGDVEEVTQLVMKSTGGPYGWHKCCTEEVTREILKKAIV